MRLLGPFGLPPVSCCRSLPPSCLPGSKMTSPILWGPIILSRCRILSRFNHVYGYCQFAARALRSRFDLASRLMDFPPDPHQLLSCSGDCSAMRNRGPRATPPQALGSRSSLSQVAANLASPSDAGTARSQDLVRRPRRGALPAPTSPSSCGQWPGSCPTR